MDYKFSFGLKRLTVIFMLVGLVGIAWGFWSAPTTVEQAIEKANSGHHGADSHGVHNGGHESSHAKDEYTHSEDGHESDSDRDLDDGENSEGDSDRDLDDGENSEADTEADTESDSDGDLDDDENSEADTESDYDKDLDRDQNSDDGYESDSNGYSHQDYEEDNHHEIHSEHQTNDHGSAHGDASSHGKHLLHQLQNKPWASVYVAGLFFFFIALGTLAFYAVQRASQAGWPIVLFRVMEGITAYVIPGGIIVLIILLFSVFGYNHMFVWMDPDVVAHDEIIQNKTWYLNTPGFVIRAIVILAGWGLYRYFSRKFSLRQDISNAIDITYHKRNFKLAAGFLVFYIVSVSVMSWDWLMSIDPHWFSTLFGWYVFASMFVSGITVIALVTIYLKSKGYLEFVNSSHIHDLAKFMFGISIFWTYLWFSQFMLIWYANIPEEVTYFITRLEDYKVPFISLLVLNFIFPVLVLMNTDFKRTNYIVVVTGLVIVIGHYLDVYNMVMPGTVLDHWSFGVTEIGAFLFFLGLFVHIIFRALEKAPLLAKGDPLVEESKRFHY